MDILSVFEAEGHEPGARQVGAVERPPIGVIEQARHVGRRAFVEVGFVAVLITLAVLLPILGREHADAVLIGGLGVLTAAVWVGGWVGESALGPRPHAPIVGAFGALCCLALGLLAAGAWSVLTDPANLGLEGRIYDRMVLPLFWGEAIGGWVAAPLGALAGWLTRRRLSDEE